MRRQEAKASMRSRDDVRDSESGDTLIEVLLALMILGIAGVALLVGFATAITTSSEHRHLASLDSSVRAASAEAIAQVQSAQDDVFGSCTPPSTFRPTFNLTSPFTVPASSVSVQYWNGTNFSSNLTTNPCTKYGPQLWTMTVTDGHYTSPPITTVVYDPQAPPVSGGTTPSELVFLQPSGTGTSTVNADLSPEPLVAVEDHGLIVYSDASSVTLSIYSQTPGGGSLSSSCSGVENDGVVSFGDCSLSAVGTYQLMAKDSDGLSSTTYATYTISTAPPAQLNFITSPVVQTASTAAGTTAITVQEQSAFNVADPGPALTVALTSTSSKGVFWAGAPLAPVTSVTIPAGSSTATFYYSDTVSGSPTITAASGGLQPGMQAETINAGAASQVAITPTPTSAAVSTTTNVKLGFQLQDQYGNNATAPTGGLSLTVSTNSAKGFFYANNAHSGTLGASVSIPFASGAGTATEYYGDETVGTPTITAKSGTPATTWGTTPLTITAGPPATIAVSSGSGQSALVNTTFTNPLVATVTDSFGNPVSGASVTFSGPASGASETFASSGNCTSNPQVYSCVVTTGTNGQATSSAFTANTTSGGYNISAAVTGATTVNFTATNTPGNPGLVKITPTPASAAASGTTNIKLGFQLVDRYGNNATAGAGGISLTVSTSSAKGFFNTANGATGTFGASTTVNFASGAGTATQYYGDETASPSTAITAANGSAAWGSTTVAITAQTTGDTLSLVSGTPQSTTVGNAFGAPLVVKDVDQYGNLVSGVTVTFDSPGLGRLGHLHHLGHRGHQCQRRRHLEHLHGQHHRRWPLQRRGLGAGSHPHDQLRYDQRRRRAPHGHRDLGGRPERDGGHGVHQPAGGHGDRPVRQQGLGSHGDLHPPRQWRVGQLHHLGHRCDQRRWRRHLEHIHREHDFGDLQRRGLGDGRQLGELLGNQHGQDHW